MANDTTDYARVITNEPTGAVQTGNRWDLIAQAVKTLTTAAPTDIVPNLATQKADYAAIAVVCSTFATVKMDNLYCCNALVNASLTGGSVFGAPTQYPGGGSYYNTAIMPMAVDKTAAVSIHIYSGTAYTTVTIMVYGLTANPGVLLRPDSRAYPIGRFAASGGVSTTTLIAAPKSPLRILLTSLNVYTVQSAGTMKFPSVWATINGTRQEILALPAVPTGAVTARLDIPPRGLLLDAATAVTWTRATVQHAGLTATYDLAP